MHTMGLTCASWSAALADRRPRRPPNLTLEESTAARSSRRTAAGGAGLDARAPVPARQWMGARRLGLTLRALACPRNPDHVSGVLGGGRLGVALAVRCRPPLPDHRFVVWAECRKLLVRFDVG